MLEKKKLQEEGVTVKKSLTHETNIVTGYQKVQDISDILKLGEQLERQQQPSYTERVTKQKETRNRSCNLI